VDDLSPEVLYDRAFAEEALAGAWRDLELEEEEDGQIEICRALRGHLNDEATATYRAIGANLNIKGGTLKSHASGLRRRLRELIEERVGHTVADQSDVQSEMQILEESYGQ
jgi:hypothetical protein